VSARLDGELPPDRALDLDAHLAVCPACRRWQDDAAAVTRRFRTAPVTAGVEVTEAVLPAAPGPGRARLALTLRIVLGGFGIAQLLLGVFQVTVLRTAAAGGLHDPVDGASPGHLWHETAAWNIAVGAAFLWVATRRSRPVGILPILSVFIGVLVLLSASDLLAGQVDPARLASHAFVLVGYLVVLALSRTPLDLQPPAPAGRLRRGRRLRTADGPPPQNVIRFPNSGQPAARARREAA